jgi:hypothetical protein
MRRFNEGAYNHRGDSAQNEADRRRLRHLDHIRFGRHRGLHVVLHPDDTGNFLTVSNWLSDVDRHGNQSGWRCHDERERQAHDQSIRVANGDADHHSYAQYVGRA